VGLESYALESRRLGVTDRARSEDTAHEVVEEVLHVATTLRDMGRGENVRNGVGRDTADGSAHLRAVLWATNADPNEHDDRGEARDSMCTPRALRKVGYGRGCEAGSSLRTSECTRAYGQATRRWTSAWRKSPRRSVQQHPAHCARSGRCCAEDGGQRRKNQVEGVAANPPTRGRAKIGSPGNESHLLLLSIGSDAHGEGWHVGLRVSSTTASATREGVKAGPGQTSRGAY